MQLSAAGIGAPVRTCAACCFRFAAEEIRSMRPPRQLMRFPVALWMLLSGLPVHAVEYEVQGGKLTVTGSVTAGSAWRTTSQDTALLPNVNSSQVGITGNAITPAAGRNQDDGNLNFNKVDPISQVVNGYLAL